METTGMFRLADADQIVGSRPGERMLHGRPYVFDLDRLNAHIADEALQAFADAGEAAATLSDDDLTGLFYQWQNRQARLPFDRLTIRVGATICGERARRIPNPFKPHGTPVGGGK